jgi:hypothetical protein
MKRLAFLVVVALCSLGLAAPVLAAAPLNDTYATRQVINALPFSDSLDTSEATTDALDGEANECGAPFTDASVWYEFVPDADAQIIIDTQGSDYATGIFVMTGSPGSFTLQACGATGVTVGASAGVTLTILVFDYDGEGNGGNLELTVSLAPPPPIVDLAVDPSGSFNSRTGLATVRGTVTCTNGFEDGKNLISVQLTQAVGRFKFSGEGWTVFTCDGTAHAWAVDVGAANGKFGGGKATVFASAFACAFDCGEDTVERTVTLKK